ncbi:MAG: glycerophosphodiester phosphodiesterase family protein, partial [Alphaproteobacteria bacterium]
MSLPDLRLPKVIGHRGAALRAPENTLAGFRKAAALGCRWVEFDVRLSLDDVAVVFHDDRLERVTGSSGPIGGTPFSTLKALDAGSFFAPDYKGEAIPSLEETLLLLRGLGLAFDLELKADPGRERALAEVAARTLEALWPRALPRPLVTSFEPTALTHFARRAPEVARGYLVTALPRNWRDEAAGLGVCAVICDHRRLAPEAARAVKEAGYPL